jgi:hypothetical protein
MGGELNEQIDVALARPEVVAQGRTEDIQTHDPAARTQSGDDITFVSQYIDHIAPP